MDALPEFKGGDEVTFQPFPEAWTFEPVTGLYVEEIKSTGDTVGWHIFAPTPDDKTRVVRVWASDGRLMSAKEAAEESAALQHADYIAKMTEYRLEAERDQI